MLYYVYIISYTFLFFLTHVLGRLAVVLRVYRVKIVSASVHIPLCLCTHVCLSTARARSTRFSLSHSLYMRMCACVYMCVCMYDVYAIVMYCVLMRAPLRASLQITCTLYSFRSACRF